MDKNQSNIEKVHNLIILDESGSMCGIGQRIITGFNEIAKNIKALKQENPDQAHSISFVSFNTMGNKEFHFMEDADLLENLDINSYAPNGGTPLFDAMGYALTKLSKAIGGQKNVHVFVSVLTDGEENASTEYTGHAIKKLVESLKEKNWTFTYIGADHDVEKMAETMSINNHMAFNKSSAGMGKMFEKEKFARSLYMKSASKSRFSLGNIFEENEVLDFKGTAPGLQRDNSKMSRPITGRKKSFWEKLTGK